MRSTMLRPLPALLLGAGLFACASLKTASPDEPGEAATNEPAPNGAPSTSSSSGGGIPTGTSSGDPETDPQQPGKTDGGATSDGASSSSSSSSSSGANGNGDPRWPQGPVPADAPAASSYTIQNGPNGAIVTDLVTGLSWQDTIAAASFDFAGAATYCDSLSYAGFTDWRAPTRIEAVSIMKLGGANETELAGSVFSGTDKSCAWTLSKVAPWGGVQQGWSVGRAAIMSEQTYQTCAVRCVRGGPPVGAPVPPEYTLTADTVTDPVTRLVWERNPPSVQTLWADADARCKALVLDGHTMHLPTVKELLSITDETKARDGALSLAFGGPREDHYFTSNPRWNVGFQIGHAYQAASGFERYSRCVASLP